MRIFQNEQELRNVLVLLPKKRIDTEFARSQTIGLSCVHGRTRCWDTIRNTRQNRTTLLSSVSWSLPCYRYGMICHKGSSIRQSHHFETRKIYFNLQLVDIVRTLSLKTETAADIRYWNVWTVDEKFVQSYWIFRTRLHVHLKKWTLKFKRLYLLNHVS